MRLKKALIFSFLLLNSVVAFNQNLNKENSNESLYTGHSTRKYKSQTFILKFSPEGKRLFKKQHGKIPLEGTSELGIQSVERMFPDMPQTYNQRLSPDATRFDLSRTYVVTYSAPIDVKTALSKLKRSNLIEYTEPYYLDETLIIPNDPYAQPDSLQWYLKRYKAYQAWDVCKGDTNTVVGVVDTGTRISHEDLIDHIKYDLAELYGITGVDDDHDGYVDNYEGWDFGNNDNNPDATGDQHGTIVTSIAAATTNNNLGIAGTGFNCKYLPVKAASDAQGGSISYGYQGIYYAATHGVKVINTSWGGASGFSQTAQDVINYVVLGLDVVLVAAAGNSNKDELYYPASYDHVLSVAASDTVWSPSANQIVDTKAWFSTYNYDVDLCAQGRRVAGAYNNGGYNIGPGSSFSSPQVAGAAALVRSYRPHLKAIQVMEQMRVTGDIVDTFPETIQYKEKYGRRLNMYLALTDTLKPAVRALNITATNQFGNSVFSGDTANITLQFVNYLHPTTNCKVTLSSPSPYIKMIDSVINLGVISTFDTVTNTTPFKAYIKAVDSLNMEIPFRIQFDDINYYDYQWLYQLINPSYITIDTNKIALTVASNGRNGYADTNDQIGKGLIFQDSSMLFESGLMIGLDSSTVSDCVRGNPALTTDLDFKNIIPVHYFSSPYAPVATSAQFNDSSSVKPIGITVTQNSYAWDSPGNTRYIIVEYKIINQTPQTFDSLYAGLFTDWDIMNASRNRADWDSASNTGYIYSIDANGLYGGVSLLTNTPVDYYALDNSSVGGNNINPNDGFTTQEKFETLSKGVFRKQAGTAPGGDDVSHVVGTAIVNFKPGETRKVAFAYIAGNNLSSITTSAVAAKNMYKSFNTGAIPIIAKQDFCLGDTVNVTLSPSNGTDFNFYKPQDALVKNGTNLTLNNVYQSDTVYVTNTDSLFESNPSMVVIHFLTPVSANFSMNQNPLDLASGSPESFTAQTTNIQQVFWSFGNGINSHTSDTSVYYQSTGDFPVTLTTTDTAGCKSQKTDTLMVINSSITGINQPSATTLFRLYPVPASKLLTVEWNSGSHCSAIILINSIGQEILKQENLKDNTTTINVTDLTRGVYFITLNLDNQTVTRSFIKY